jgi:hypothetical protein
MPDIEYKDYPLNHPIPITLPAGTWMAIASQLDTICDLPQVSYCMRVLYDTVFKELVTSIAYYNPFAMPDDLGEDQE